MITLVQTNRSWRSSRPLRMAVVATALFTVMVLMVYFALRPDPASGPVLPVPNGYDFFLEAIAAGTAGDYRAMDLKDLRVFVESNANALELVRRGMRQECRVPVQYSMEWASTNTSTIGRMRGLALTLAAEGRLAELEGRQREAAYAYLDVVRFGTESIRGGLLIHALVGVAIQSVGTRHLTEVAPQLDARTSREIALLLEQLDQQAESWEVLLSHEREWVRRSYPFYTRGAALVMSKSIKQTEQKAESKFHQQQLTLRSLSLELAGRAFELENGKSPASAADLVPGYLTAVPRDPATGAELPFRAAESGE
jgi:hypothetical protein